tara:strand:- start:99 stop:1622 length:1524 start_codon:yes stop_codon:yes gene_type:complete
MVSNEVFVGAGTMATLVPEMDMYFNNMLVTWADGNTDLNVAVLIADDRGKFKFLTDLYIGCRAKVTNVTTGTISYVMITSNTETSFTFDSDVSLITSSGTEDVDVKLLAFGAPVIAPSATNQKLLSDNWLGLVNTFSPPSVDVETKQLALMGGNTRNLSYQYKGAETVSGGSLDISLNNGSWLYYALGKVTTLGATNNSTDWTASTSDKFVANATTFGLVRVPETNIEYPPLSTDATDTDDAGNSLANYNELASDSVLTYTFGESNGPSLPSFGLDVSYRKAGVAATTAVDNLAPHENMYSRIFTGCQVNTLTLNFEEGQELKTSLDLVTRRAYDVVTDGTTDYIPHNGVLTPSLLKNFSATALDNNPFMFSDGALKVFGQTYARVKSGSITINNNITPQRFIGNTSRQVMNEHIPAQRTYEVSMVVLITDTTLWDELRKETESTGDIELHFSKSGDNFIKLALRDYVIQTVDIPFPEDKGAIEATFTASARTLVNAQYKGKWALMH